MQVADATTGKELYKARVGGGGMTFSSSPLASNGRIYAVSEDGDVVVFEAGDESDRSWIRARRDYVHGACGKRGQCGDEQGRIAMHGCCPSTGCSMVS